MSRATITKREIDSLYKKAGVTKCNETPSSVLNHGTLNNRLVNKFSGAKARNTMKGSITNR